MSFVFFKFHNWKHQRYKQITFIDILFRSQASLAISVVETSHDNLQHIGVAHTSWEHLNYKKLIILF